MMADRITRIRAIEGPNFSGRTALLKRSVAQEKSGLYLGPEVSSYLSGICVSVFEEIALYNGSAQVAELLAALQLEDLAHRNPFTLSGGEQVLTLIAGAIAARPEFVALDTILEQLDAWRRAAALHALSAVPAVQIADNRISEFRDSITTSEYLWGCDATERAVEPIGPLQGYAIPEYRTRPCTLALDGVRFGYHRQVPTLRDVSIFLEPGRIYALQGANGAGKSTLAKLLVGVLRFGGGRMLRDGRPFDPHRRPAEAVAYHFQHPDVQLFSRTVARELAVGAPPGPDHTSRIRLFMRGFGLQRLDAQGPFDLPFVARKRVALAATFAMERPWTILDEPTFGQDDANVAELVLMLKAWASRGAGIIVITHSSDFIQQLNAHVLILKDGVLTG